MTLSASAYSPRAAALPEVHSLRELENLVTLYVRVYVRFSAGPEPDLHRASRDHESGSLLPGLTVNPLREEAWWTRPSTDWIARQICRYADSAASDPHGFAWVLTGNEVGRGPDCEPLLTHVRPLARLSPTVLDEARSVYEAHFCVGAGPAGID